MKMLKRIGLSAWLATGLVLQGGAAVAEETAATAAQMPVEQNFLGLVYRDAEGSMPYRLFVPKEEKAGVRYPLLVFLHGAGERGDDNVAQLTHAAWFAQPMVQNEYPCFVLAPQCPADAAWGSWGKPADQPSRQLRQVLAIIRQVMKTEPIDPRRVYVTGVSMGGNGTWEMLRFHPELFAAAAPVCGWGVPEAAGGFAGKPVWAFHGADDPVVEPAGSRRMVEAIEAAGGKAKYTEYPTVKHNSWINAYHDPAFYQWLFGQELGEEPVVSELAQ